MAAKKQEARPQRNERVKLCEECRFSRPIDTAENKDWRGRFILFRCEFREFAVLRVREACDRWEKRKNKQ